MNAYSAERRRRLTHRALPALAGLAVVALAAGMLVGGMATNGAEQTASRFVRAWEHGDHRAMYRLLDDPSRRQYSLAEFRRAHRAAAATATATRIRAGDPESEGDQMVVVPITVVTRVFGRVRAELRLPVSGNRLVWGPLLAFPGLRTGEALSRRSDPPRRASLLARDGRVLAKGPAQSRNSPLAVAGSVAGVLGPEEDAEARDALYARGFPPDWPVGRNGLERAFERRLGGKPGGVLLAGRRVLARARPRPAAPVRTTIEPSVQEAAVTALAGRFGGIAALDPRNGEIRALAGVAFSAPQPPGSTFKIVTATAALEAGLVEPSTEFPVQSFALVDGVELENANGEFCGGSFQQSFAHSCNSVFAPLGVKIGAKRLVDAAERFGWNAAPVVPGEVPSTLPPASEIRSELEVGSTAIGQFRVLATPLMLASTAQTVASRGVRRVPTLVPGGRTPTVRVTSRRVARMVGRMMVDVVAYGTGTAATIAGVKVAGKTGTAELEDTRGPNADETKPDDPLNTDAWFTAYAPAGRPRIVVAALFVRAGSGGATAAPAARIVLEAGLRR